MRRGVVLAALLVLGAGCSQTKATTMEWIRVETDDLIIRTDVRESAAVELATKWQALRDAIADNELPCAFERANSPFEFVLLKDPADVVDLHRGYTTGFPVGPPSSQLYSKTQWVLDYREAFKNPQVFLHELAGAAAALCFPGARPWLHEGMASFYETASVRDGELVLGMPAFGFVHMDNVEPRYDIYPVRVNGAEVWMLPLRLAPDFDELRVMDDREFYFLGKRRSVEDLRATTAHYAGSWNAVHMLQFGDEALSEQFMAYLSGLNQGVENDRAWDAAFAEVDVAAMYDRYLKSDYKMSSRRLTTPPAPEPSVHPMSEGDIGLLYARLYGWSNDEDSAKAAAFIAAAERGQPNSGIVMLHRAAFEYDTVSAEAGEQWLDRALAEDPTNPTVLATALMWYSRPNAREPRRADLDSWAETLAPAAQTAFEFRELAKYRLMVEGDPEAAFEPLNRSLMLDATDWETYAYAGRALSELGRTDEAIRAYETAIALTGEQSISLRESLKEAVAELREEFAPTGQ